jgi:hypothetical protein
VGSSRIRDRQAGFPDPDPRIKDFQSIARPPPTLRVDSVRAWHVPIGITSWGRHRAAGYPQTSVAALCVVLLLAIAPSETPASIPASSARIRSEAGLFLQER